MQPKTEDGRPSASAQEPSATQALRATVCEEAAGRCVEKFGDSLRALVLTGSLARDEATFVEEGDGWRMLGDAELLLIFRKNAALPPRSSVCSVRQEIEQGLCGRKVRCPIDLAAVRPAYLQQLPPHILTYELRTCGQVVWGDSQILSMVTTFSASDISREDAWHMLCNRLVELLESAPDLEKGNSRLSQPLRYRATKLYLDMATSLLVFVGGYAPTYRERERNLRRLAKESTRHSEWPFELAPFAEQVTSCTEWKLSPDSPRSEPASDFCQEAVQYARRLWRWELERLTRSRGNQLSDRDLLLRWMQHQPATKRARGWLSVLRRCGWHRSWRNWARWARPACQASPRLWVYAAASELLFRLPCLQEHARQRSETETGLQELRSWLPIRRESKHHESLCWQQLASEVAWNYHEFLENTRS